MYLIFLLIVALVFIIVATGRWRGHPFLVLLVAGYGLGILAGLPLGETVQVLTGGFGKTMGYIGIVIAAGTIIGHVLERGGAVVVMAETVLRWVGQARAVLAMGVTGAVVSISVFCDSGYIILSPLNKSLSARSGISLTTYVAALSMGLYATHVFVPPTPGPIAAAGALGADIGSVILFGLLVTVPVLFTTHLFARYIGRRIVILPAEGMASDGIDRGDAHPTPHVPSALLAFAPILVPVLLIALNSVATLPSSPFGEGQLAVLIGFAGNPNTALLIGVLLAFLAVRGHGAEVYGTWVGAGLKEAGPILLITGAGGALGAVLQATPIGAYLGETLATLELGPFNLLLPFLIAAALKTALGSSTVAIITTASLVAPLLGSLGLEAGQGAVLTTLAIGAGAMTVSHANDSYFWVVGQFSGLDVAQTYQVQTIGSAVAGVTGIMTIFLLGLIIL